jgi:hypothetical protein
MEKNKFSDDIEYTIVMSANDIKKAIPGGEAAQIAADPKDEVQEAHRNILDRLYYEYERMWLREPTVLDKDDIYPRSYQWRLDKYDPGKEEVLMEALEHGTRITDTEAYKRYIENYKEVSFTPLSWD